MTHQLFLRPVANKAARQTDRFIYPRVFIGTLLRNPSTFQNRVAPDRNDFVLLLLGALNECVTSKDIHKTPRRDSLVSLLSGKHQVCVTSRTLNSIPLLCVAYSPVWAFTRIDFFNSEIYIGSMWTWLVTSLSILVITFIELLREKEGSVKRLFVLFCLLGLVSSFLSFIDNNELSSKLGQIDAIESKLDSLRDIRSVLASDVLNLSRGVDSLLARRDSIASQIRASATQLDSLMSFSRNLIRTEQTQLSGKLEAHLGTPKPQPSGLYKRVDKFRSLWAQDIQDVSISMRFDSTYQQVSIQQKASGGLLNVTCPSADTVIVADHLNYTCDFLARGNWIEIITFSKTPLAVTSCDLLPK